MSHPAPRRWIHWLGRSLAHVHYARHVEPTWLEVNRFAVRVTGLPPEFDGFRIVQLSDLHCSNKIGPWFIDEAVDLARAERPDLVVVTGDFIHHGFRHIPQAAAHVRRLTAPLGVFAVLGNHDYSIRNALGLRRYRHLHRAVAAALTAEGVRVLRNEAVKLTRGGATLDLIGVDDLWSRTCDLDRAFSTCDPVGPHIVLCITRGPWNTWRAGGATSCFPGTRTAVKSDCRGWAAWRWARRLAATPPGCMKSAGVTYM